MKHVAKPADACEAETISESYRKGQRCPNRFSIRIGNRLLCQRHAALEALFLAAQDGTAKRLTREARCIERPRLYGSSK